MWKILAFFGLKGQYANKNCFPSQIQYLTCFVSVGSKNCICKKNVEPQNIFLSNKQENRTKVGIFLMSHFGDMLLSLGDLRGQKEELPTWNGKSPLLCSINAKTTRQVLKNAFTNLI